MGKFYRRALAVASPQAVAFGASALQPWQFQPETYGAAGNGIAFGDATTNGTSTVVSPTIGAAGQAAVGRSIMINGANGATGATYIGTITAVAGSNITVSGTAPTGSQSNCAGVFGSDDTAAFQSCMTAMSNFALGVSGSGAGFGGYLAEMVLSSKIYVLSAGPFQTGNGTSTVTFNTQVPIPYPAANGTSQKLVIMITGPGDAGSTQYWQSLVPAIGGAALVSMQTTGTTPNPTFGFQSVIGGPTGGAGFSSALGQSFANVKVSVRGVSVWLPIYTNIYAFDFRYVSQARVQQSGAQIVAPSGTNVAAAQPYRNQIGNSTFTSSVGKGFAMPVSGNNDDIVMDDVAADGYENGFMIFDHFVGGRMAAINCDVCVFWNGGLGASGVMHGLYIQSMSAENYNGGLLANGTRAPCEINWDFEGSGVAYDVSDSNSLYGLFRFADPINQRVPTITGGAHLKVINDAQSPGHMASPPAVPATTVAAALVYRDAMVKITTGVGVTVSAVTVDGTATGQTLAASSTLYPVRVPSGKTIALTYAGGTPTWDWWLD